MNKKDIALSVGGVLATMVLAYLLYRLQQRDAAQAAPAQDDTQYTTTAQVNPYYGAETLSTQSPVITGTTTNTAATETTSAAAADLGAYVDSTDINNLLGEIASRFSGSIDTSSVTPEHLDLMTIPAISGVTQTSLQGIPVTAEDAAAQALLAISPSVSTFDTSTAAYLPAMESSLLVSSHPVQAHPIVSIGS